MLTEMFGAWSLWHSPNQKPRDAALRARPPRSLRLATALSLCVVAHFAVAQQPVPIPSFDPPSSAAAKNSPPASAPASIPPANGTAVVIPTTPANGDSGTETPAFQQPPARAQVKLDSTGLSIRARNSSLSQILRDVAGASGMKVDGFSRDERVFGNFGPDEPHRVLSNLLDGSGYNVIMVGNTDKATPKVLSLSPRAQSGQPDVAPETPTLAANPDDEGEQMTDDPADQQPETSIPANIPPGVPSPDSAQAPAPDADTPTIRTPQQILEDLQRVHQQADPQQPAPGAPTPPQQ